MSRRRGRPPQAPPAPPVPVTGGDRAIEELIPASERAGMVVCLVCDTAVPSIGPHLAAVHKTMRLEDYTLRFPEAPLEPEGAKEQRRAARAKRMTATDDEIAAHPCGADGIILEKAIAREERVQFRRDCQDLLKRGFVGNYEIASLAHTMILARRARLQIEQVRDEAEGEVYQSQITEFLKDLEGKIEKGLKALETTRSQRLKDTAENPLAALEEELQRAEDWIREHIGEFAERCPGCGQPLTPPALPHWAFEPVKNDQGVLYWPVWSEELWKLVLERTIPLWVMAYTLRTSPEGLKFTARRKKLEWPAWIDVVWEERELRTRLLADDKAAPAFAVVDARKETNG